MTHEELVEQVADLLRENCMAGCCYLEMSSEDFARESIRITGEALAEHVPLAASQMDYGAPPATAKTMLTVDHIKDSIQSLTQGNKRMRYQEELSRVDKGFYIAVSGIVDGSEFGTENYKSSHAETKDGHYVGDLEFAERLAERCIQPELAAPDNRVCSIGYSGKHESWFGWSHRAIYGFKVGSEVKRGDCAYVPTDMEDARMDAIRFWSGESHLNVTAGISKDEEGKPCFDVKWCTTDDPDIVPNEKMRGTISGVRHYPPEQFGKGEWTATTMEDAKQMAIDFAEGVS